MSRRAGNQAAAAAASAPGLLRRAYDRMVDVILRKEVVGTDPAGNTYYRWGLGRGAWMACEAGRLRAAVSRGLRTGVVWGDGWDGHRPRRIQVQVGLEAG